MGSGLVSSHMKGMVLLGELFLISRKHSLQCPIVHSLQSPGKETPICLGWDDGITLYELYIVTQAPRNILNIALSLEISLGYLEFLGH